MIFLIYDIFDVLNSKVIFLIKKICNKLADMRMLGVNHFWQVVNIMNQTKVKSLHRIFNL